METCCKNSAEYQFSGNFRNNVRDSFIFLFDICLIVVGLFITYFWVNNTHHVWVFAFMYIIFGRIIWKKVFKEIRNFSFFNEHFLMTLASIAAFSLKEYNEGLAIIFFYRLGEVFISYAENKSSRAIQKLTELKPNFVRLKKEDEWVEVPIEKLKKGDVYRLFVGERNATDATIIKGNGTLDKSIISGESLPVFVEEGQKILAGTLLQQGSLELMALKKASESSFQHIIDLSKKSQKNKSQAEIFIRVFSRYYTPCVIILSVVIIIIPIFLKMTPWDEAVRRAATLLITACPCALIISIPLSYFSAMGRASQLGLIFKGSQYIAQYARVGHFVFDKTGTLTLGSFALKKVVCFSGTQDELIYLGSQIAQYSLHPLAQALLNYGKTKNVSLEHCDNIEEYGGLGIACNFKNKKLLLGQNRWLKEHNVQVTKQETEYNSAIYIGYDGFCLGLIIFEDTMRPSSVALIDALREEKMNLSILSGDNEAAVKNIADELKINHYRSNLLPEEKLSLLSKIIAKSHKCVAYVGDGINDLPSIARADVGIAIGEGSDSALEIADVILLGKNSYGLFNGFKLAQKTQTIVWQNIIFAIGVKFLILVLGIFGISHIWHAIFADTGVTVLTILNAFRLFQHKINK